MEARGSRSRPRRAAGGDTGRPTALRSVGLLDVVSTTSPGPSVARLVSTPVSTASRRTLVRNAGQETRNFNRDSGRAFTLGYGWTILVGQDTRWRGCAQRGSSRR